MPAPTFYLHGYSGDKYGLKDIAESFAMTPFHLLDLPGFGESPDPPEEALADIYRYAETVWAQIRRKEPHGKVRLIGHSHGAMVAFAIAAAHKEEVESVALLCPVALPRWPARLLVRSLQLLRRLLGTERTLHFISRRWFVDLVSMYSMQRNWSRATRQLIFRTRRREARQYRPCSIDMMVQTLSFQESLEDARVDVPTLICYARNDIVAGSQDAHWFRTRCRGRTDMVSVHGGHLVVIAEPQYVVDELHAQADSSPLLQGEK